VRWKKLNSVKLFEHPRLSVFEDDVELPSGKQTKYIHFGKSVGDSAMIIAVNDSGAILLQKEYSYPPDEVLYQLPGGAIEPGEHPEKGASRELAEEAGLAGDLTLLGWFYVNNRRSNQKMYIYEARNLQKVVAQKDPEELFEDHWLTEVEIDELIRTNELRNYTAIAGWSFYRVKHL
jgi:ADP-ribose pyrophosphatase